MIPASTQPNLSDEHINEYLAELGTRVSEQGTVHRYRYVLHSLLNYCKKEHKNFQECSKQDIINFKLQLDREPVTVNFYLVVIREFFRFLEKRNICENITKGVDNLREEKKIPSFVDKEDLERLFNLTDNNPGAVVCKSPGSEMLNIRDLAIFEILIGTGITAVELCELKREEINLDEMYVHIPTRKKKIGRTIPIPRTTLKALKKYSEYRQKVFEQSQYFFLYRTGAQFSRWCVNRICKKFLKQTDSRKKSPQTLRYTYIDSLSVRGADILALKYLTGHARIFTTKKYMDLSNRRTPNTRVTKSRGHST